MQKIVTKVVSLYDGSGDEMSQNPRQSIDVEFDGIVGDGHKSFTRVAWAGGDKQPEGTIRRNERQWSAVSVEELEEIGNALDLTEPPSATCLAANLCLSGVPNLSQLPKGTVLKFPSGAELAVEEYNSPCSYMGEKVASMYTTHTGKPLSFTAFSKAAKLTRGIVGVVEVPGRINVGDSVVVEIYEHPAWLS